MINLVGENFATSPTLGTFTSAPVVGDSSWNEVIFANGIYVAVGTTATGPNEIMTSTDGETWTAQTSASVNAWNNITYGNGLFVVTATGNTNEIQTSPDGVTWTLRTAPESANWVGVSFGNGVFTALNSDGTNRVATSTDGITWTARTASEVQSWEDIAFGSGLFVAIHGAGSTYMTSPDGITWTTRSAAGLGFWTHVTSANDVLFVQSVFGSTPFLTSIDGINWVSQTPAESNSWVSTTYGNGLYVSVASSGTNRVQYSEDLVTWTSAPAAQANTWRSIVFANDKLVAVSSNGTNRVMTADLTAVNTMATVRPQSGERLNDVVNGTQVIDTAGTFYVAVDRDSGNWDIKAVGEGGLSQKGVITSDALSGQGIYTLDSSGAAFALSLPASTGSQDRYMLLQSDTETNDVTVGVQAGEVLNGVADGTFTANTNGQVLLATDRATGIWDLAVVGAGRTTDLHRVRMNRTAAWSPTTGVDTKVSYDAENHDIGNIGDIATGTVTIADSGYYRVNTGWQNTTGSNNVQAQIWIDGARAHRGGDSKSSGGGSLWATAETEIYLTAGQTVEGYAFSGQATSGNISDAADLGFLEVSQQPTATQFLAGMVTPNSLAYSSGNSPTLTVGSEATVVGAGYDVIDLGSANFTFYDPNSNLDTTNNYYTVPSDGLYEVIFSQTPDFNGAGENGAIYVEGVLVALGDIRNGTGTPNDTVPWMGQLTAGQRIEMGFQTTAAISFSNVNFTIKQLPISTVVDPGDVPVIDVEVVLDAQTITNGGTLALPADLTPYEYIRFEGEDLGVNNVSVTELVQASNVANSRIAMHHDDATGYVYFDIDATGTIATLTSTGSFVGNSPYRVVGVRAQQTVINTVDLMVDDQATSGYFDFGEMRMQWGTVSDGNSDGDVIVTLPAAFLNTTYSVVATSQTAGQEWAVGTRPTGTTSFTLNRNDAANATIDWNWQAIGLRP